VLLLAGFVLDWWPMAAIVGVILLLGAALGPRYGPFIRLYSEAIRPRLAPPDELEDPRAPRFAATVGVVFLAGATLAGLAAVTGICVGCEVWLFLARRRGVPLSVGA
jgi:hypothetical protein